MILSDTEITALAEQGMITPFTPRLVREQDGHPALSYGLSSYGYDIRLSPREFVRFVPCKQSDPKGMSEDTVEPVPLQHDDRGSFFVMPPHSFALGVAMESLAMPPDVTAIVLTKSTYARTGAVMPLGKVHAGWSGHLTLEFINPTPSPARLYAGEGIAHLEFRRGRVCEKIAQDGRYTNQPHRVVFGGVA